MPVTCWTCGTIPGPASTDPTVPNYLVAHSRSARFLSAQGYETVFFPFPLVAGHQARSRR